MSRKDYVLIAKAIRESRDVAVRNAASPSAFTALEEVAGRLADALARNNPDFQRAKFMRATGC